MIRRIDPSEAALLVPLNAVVQDLHVAHRPDVFRAGAAPEAVVAYFAEWIARPGVFVLVADDADGKPLGYAMCELQPVAENAMTAARLRGYVHHVAVLPAARRQGIAAALLTEAKARFVAAGATVWTTSYWVWNAPSAALMAKMGLAPAIVVADAQLP